MSNKSKFSQLAKKAGFFPLRVRCKDILSCEKCLNLDRKTLVLGKKRSMDIVFDRLSPFVFMVFELYAHPLKKY